MRPRPRHCFFRRTERIKRYFVTADLEWFVTGYPHEHCDISNKDFPILFPEVDEAARVAALANEQCDSKRFQVARLTFPINPW